MDIYEFVTQMAEQHKSLLKVIDLQNNSIQTINRRLNAMAASQLVMFALLTEPNKMDKSKIARHLQEMLRNPDIAGSRHLAGQLKGLLEICGEDCQFHRPDLGKPAPAWFKGIVQGGLSASSVPEQPNKE